MKGKKSITLLLAFAQTQSTILLYIVKWRWKKKCSICSRINKLCLYYIIYTLSDHFGIFLNLLAFFYQCYFRYLEEKCVLINFLRKYLAVIQKKNNNKFFFIWFPPRISYIKHQNKIILKRLYHFLNYSVNLFKINFVLFFKT